MDLNDVCILCHDPLSLAANLFFKNHRNSSYMWCLTTITVDFSTKLNLNSVCNFAEDVLCACMCPFCGRNTY